MGVMKRRAIARMLRWKKSQRVSRQTSARPIKSTPHVSPRDTVTLAKCRTCGRSEFTLRFEQRKVSDKILAECVGCKTSRPIGLDAAHAAWKQAKKKRRKKEHAHRSGPTSGDSPRSAVVSGVPPNSTGFGGCRRGASPARVTPGSKVPESGHRRTPVNPVGSPIRSIDLADASPPISPTTPAACHTLAKQHSLNGRPTLLL